MIGYAIQRILIAILIILLAVTTLFVRDCCVNRRS